MSDSLEPCTPQEVLSFWFDELAPTQWFEQSLELDATIRRRFRDTHHALADVGGIRPDWRASAETRLAAIIVLDQFPRNIFRGTPMAFATDFLALNEARLAIEGGHDQLLPEDWRCFAYLPFEHSEVLADQDRSVELFMALGIDHYLDYAERHRAVIREFGRFPHRNPILGRASTPAELAYLAKPGTGF